MSVSELRKTIIQIARSESSDPNFNRDYPGSSKASNCSPFGTVTDKVYRQDKGKFYRHGGTHLQQIMTEAVKEYGPMTWTDKTKRLYKLPPKNIEFHITNLEGVLLKDMRIPMAGNKGQGIQWCGIFATWVLIQAFNKVKNGGDIYWTVLEGKIKGKNVEYIKGNQGIQVGDVCCESGALNHHSIPFEIDEKTHTMTTVNGNSTMQSILVKEKINTAIVTGYYRIIEQP